jgi:carbazole 1,9a-dioxygenase terminal dioxygenase component
MKTNEDATTLEIAETKNAKNERGRPWDRYLDAENGLRNHWYPAFFASELAEADVSDRQGCTVTNIRTEIILGERILFRRVNGRILAITDRCRHRGVSLAARPECYTKQTITCWYHGFTYTMDTGTLTAVLTDPQSPLIGRVGVHSYPVEERAGLVWVFIGDIDAPPLELDVQPGLLDEEVAVYPHGWSNVIKCNWRTAAENGFDPSHAYIHRNSAFITDYKVPFVLGDAGISREHGMEIIEEPNAPMGVVLKRGGGTAIWEAEVTSGINVSARFRPGEAGVLNGMNPEVGIWIPCGLWVDPMPAPGIVHVEWYVPVDRNHHRYMMTWAKRVSSAEERDAFFSETANKWAHYVPTEFTKDDVFARKAMAEFYDEGNGWRDEGLFGPDVVIANWRRLVTRRARGIQPAEKAWARHRPEPHAS